MNAAERSSAEEIVRSKYGQLSESMHERLRRHWAASEAEALGYGGIAVVSRATGIAPSTIGEAHREADDADKLLVGARSRRAGGGRPRHEVAHPTLLPLLKQLVDPATRGDPGSALRWTSKSTRALASELWAAHHLWVGDKTIARLLRQLGYSLQSPKKTVEGKQHVDRNAQFEHINKKAMDCIARGLPFLSVDTKKKELVGNFKNAGQEWQDIPELVDVHDFPSDAVGKAIPYGVLDVADNSAFVNVGIDHDTPVFAVASIAAWWHRMGAARYPGARDIFITADAGGSNGYRARMWKFELQRLADRIGVTFHVSHFPPGTSKWNKIEHRLFSFISMNWRGRPLRSYETVVKLIGGTTTSAGLVVRAALDRRAYPIGKKVTPKELRELSITTDAFHGDWNYSIHPRLA